MNEIDTAASAAITNATLRRANARKRDVMLLATPMATVLDNNGVDLGDERAVFETLVPLFGEDNVVEVMEVAIEKARVLRAEADIHRRRFG